MSPDWLLEKLDRISICILLDFVVIKIESKVILNNVARLVSIMFLRIDILQKIRYHGHDNSSMLDVILLLYYKREVQM